MTRAKDELHLLIPQRFYVPQQTAHGDRHVYAQRSRFITKAMLPLFDDKIWPPLKPLNLDAIASSAPKTDIGAQLRGMWQK
jgi:DNA helicase-2/ATP-dependent DNA helicase PcrA